MKTENKTRLAEQKAVANGKSDIVLRPANDTFEEGLVYASFLNQAAEGFFGLMLGKRFAEIIADSFTTSGHDFSYENVIFAERENIIVGMAAGFSAEQHHRCSDEVLTKARDFPTIRMFVIRLFLGPLWRFLDTIETGDYYLQAIAIDKAYRGQGIGTTLIDTIVARALSYGSKRLALDVANSNLDARRLYERLGMTVQAKWPKRLPIPRLKILRMTKPLF